MSESNSKAYITIAVLLSIVAMLIYLLGEIPEEQQLPEVWELEYVPVDTVLTLRRDEYNNVWIDTLIIVEERGTNGKYDWHSQGEDY